MTLYLDENQKEILKYIFCKNIDEFFFLCVTLYPMKSILNNLFLVVHRNEKLTVFQNSHQTSSYLKKKWIEKVFSEWNY